MKKIITLVLITLFSFNIHAQFVSPKFSAAAILPEQVLSVILAYDDATNKSIKEEVKLHWKKCKYEFVTLNEIAETGKIGDYYLVAQISYGEHYSIYGGTDFGISNKDLSKACETYKKNKDVSTFIAQITINGALISTFFDPNFLWQTSMAKELNNAIVLNIRTINWLFTIDLTKYFSKGIGRGKFAGSSIAAYNGNSCELKIMTLLVSTSDTVKGKKYDRMIKNFDIKEFKQYYHAEVQIATPEKIQEYLHNDKENKYALLIEGLRGNASTFLMFRLTDGAVLYGGFIPNRSIPGYSKKMYEKFGDVCNGVF